MDRLRPRSSSWLEGAATRHAHRGNRRGLRPRCADDRPARTLVRAAGGRDGSRRIVLRDELHLVQLTAFSKGKVERAIRLLKERFFAARTFHSLAHGNAQLDVFLREIANARPHPRWQDRTVASVFEEERPRLLALPDPLPSVDLVAPIAVDKTAFVRLDTNRYSVPSEYARRTVTLVASDQVVRLLDGDREIAC